MSAFLIELLGRLEPDPMDIIQDVLIHQTQMMRNSSLGPYVPADFSPPEYIVLVNALFYASLGVMILAAFISMLIKSWVREFDRGLQAISIPEQRAKTREFRYLGMERWKLQEMVAVLPLLIQISLLLFAVGLVLFLFYISTPSFGVTTAIFGVGVLYYTITTTISVFVTSSPFHSPLSRTLGKVYHRFHAYFCPGLDGFLSPSMDITPVTALGRLRRRIQISFQKSLTYLESDFVEPITATTVDEIQLSTSASALQRIHNGVPNSPHSGVIQQSVWQVAGSPTLRMGPLFKLPSWILDRGIDEEYLSWFPPTSIVALTAVFVRMRDVRYKKRIVAVASIPGAVTASRGPWAQLVHALFDLLPNDLTHIQLVVHDARRRRAARLCPLLPTLRFIHALLHHVFFGNFPVDGMTLQGRSMRPYLTPKEPIDLLNILRKDQLDDEESIWILNTLSVLHCDGLVSMKYHVSKICLAILLHQAPKWDRKTPPNIMLIEAVVTLAAISCSSNEAYQMKTLTDSHQHPWLLLNLRNLELISRMIENLDHPFRKELTSLLFIVLYALIQRGSKDLAAQYLAIITEGADFLFCASALVSIAPALGDGGFHGIGELLLAPRTQFLSPEAGGFISDNMSDSPQLKLSHQDLFNNYDLHLGAGQSPDPKFFAILLLLSKGLSKGHGEARYHWQGHEIYLNNPWLQLTATIISQNVIPDEPGIHNISFHDDRVYDMFAALFLQQYPNEVELSARRTWPCLLVSFLESRELAISSSALHHHIRAVTSSSDPPLRSGPSCHLSGAVHAVFSPILPDDYLPKGWKILGVFADGVEQLSVEWRQSFAEAFFTLLRRPLLRGNGQQSTQVTELENILTWEYFCEEEREPEFTDADFSGLDWMAMAWSLHLSQPPGPVVTISAPRRGQPLSMEEPLVNEEFVLQVLCILLDAAPDYTIIPIIPKLREFVGWFGDATLSEYQNIISARIEGAIHRHQECERFYKFQKLHCMWYI